jgi:hypothetical protein
MAGHESLSDRVYSNAADKFLSSQCKEMPVKSVRSAHVLFEVEAIFFPLHGRCFVVGVKLAMVVGRRTTHQPFQLFGVFG